MGLFQEFLVEVNVAELRLKAAALAEHEGLGAYDTAVDARSFFDRCQNLTTEVAFYQNLGPDAYMPSLRRWARTLAWPIAPIREEYDIPCTYLELVLHHSLSSGFMPLAEYSTLAAGKRRFVAAEDREGWPQTQPLGQAVTALQEALGEAAQALGLTQVHQSVCAKGCTTPWIRHLRSAR